MVVYIRCKNDLLHDSTSCMCTTKHAEQSRSIFCAMTMSSLQPPLLFQKHAPTLRVNACNSQHAISDSKCLCACCVTDFIQAAPEEYIHRMVMTTIHGQLICFCLCLISDSAQLHCHFRNSILGCLNKIIIAISGSNAVAECVVLWTCVTQQQQQAVSQIHKSAPIC